MRPQMFYHKQSLSEIKTELLRIYIMSDINDGEFL